MPAVLVQCLHAVLSRLARLHVGVPLVDDSVELDPRAYEPKVVMSGLRLQGVVSGREHSPSSRAYGGGQSRCRAFSLNTRAVEPHTGYGFRPSGLALAS